MADPVPSVRDRLVAAAFELFDTRGFDDTTVDDIAFGTSGQKKPSSSLSTTTC
jgi:hypothetical protein